MEIRFTKQTVEYVERYMQREEYGWGHCDYHCKKIVAVDDYLGSVQPFNVGITTIKDAMGDTKLIKYSTNLPRSMCLYVDNGFIYETGDVVVIDFTMLGEIELLFIPLIPKPLEQYEFWSDKDDA